MEEKFMQALKDINKCKTQDELDAMAKYVRETFYMYKLNCYFWHLRNRIHRTQAIINNG